MTRSRRCRLLPSSQQVVMMLISLVLPFTRWYGFDAISRSRSIKRFRKDSNAPKHFLKIEYKVIFYNVNNLTSMYQSGLYRTQLHCGPLSGNCYSCQPSSFQTSSTLCGFSSRSVYVSVSWKHWTLSFNYLTLTELMVRNFIIALKDTSSPITIINVKNLI